MRVNSLLLLKYGLLVVVMVGSLLLIDLGVGVLYPYVIPESDRNALNYLMQCDTGACQASAMRIQAHSYLHYTNTPLFEDKGMKQHNADGYRNTADFSLVADSTTFRILCLGGSTTYGDGEEDPDNAWPTVLQGLLQKEVDEAFPNAHWRIEVMNGGLNSGTSFEEVLHYLFKGRKYAPDMVLVHSGGNDSRPLMLAGFKDDYSHWRRLQCSGKVQLRSGERRAIGHSHIVKLAYALWLGGLEPSTDSPLPVSLDAKDITLAAMKANIAQNSTQTFERNLTLLLSQIRQDGAQPVFMPFYFPGKRLMEEKGSKARRVAELKLNFSNYLEAYELADRKMQDAAANVCSTMQIPMLTLPYDSIAIERFVDQCHLDREGQQLQAQFVARALAPRVKQLLAGT